MVVEGPGVVVDGGAACLADPPPHAAVSAAAMSTAMSMERPGTSPSWLRAASSLNPPMSPGLLLQVLVTGLAAGAAYGLVGIGIALVYRLTGVLQLAHGDLVGGATFFVLAVVVGSAPVTRSNVGFWPLLGACLAAVAMAAAAGAGLYLGLIRPFFHRRSSVGWVAVVVAVAFAVQGVLAASFPREGYVFPDLFGPVTRRPPLALGGGASIPVRTFWLLAVAVVVALVAARWLARSTPGRAMSAIADDPDAAEVVGLPIDRLIAAGFALATALAAVAGIVVAPAAPLTPQTGLLLGLKGIAAAMVARFGSPVRVLAAGLGLGVLEAAVTSLSIGPGPAWRDLTPLLVGVAAVAIRPPRVATDAVE